MTTTATTRSDCHKDTSTCHVIDITENWKISLPAITAAVLPLETISSSSLEPHDSRENVQLHSSSSYVTSARVSSSHRGNFFYTKIDFPPLALLQFGIHLEEKILVRDFQRIANLKLTELGWLRKARSLFNRNQLSALK